MRRFAVAIVMLLAACGAAAEPVCQTSVIVETERESCLFQSATCDKSNSNKFQPKGVRIVDRTYAVTVCTHPDGTVTSSRELVR